MKITKFPQSCILVEKAGQKIVIDPGIHFLESHKVKELQDVAGVLYTHQHADHYEPKIADALKAKGVALYANAATAELIGKGCQVVHDSESFKVGNFEVTAYELPHCLLVDGTEGPQNTGYVVDSALFHPGDGKELEGLTVNAVALPIAGPDISWHDSYVFARQLRAKVAIPIHFDGIPANPEVFKQYLTKGMPLDCEIRVLQDGQSTEL